MTELAEKKEVAYVQPNFIYELDEPEDPIEPDEPSNDPPQDPSGDPSDNPSDDPSSDPSTDPSDPTEEPEVTNVIDPLRGDQWYLKYIDVQNAWDLVDELREYEGTLGKNDRVHVATIDTGVSLVHEDLQKNIDKDHCVQTIGSEIIKGKEPKFKHGTNVTSIIAATSNNGKGIAGVAAGNHNDIVSVMGINPFYDMEQKIYDEHGQRAATSADIIAALDYAKERGAQVINMSMGHYYQSLYINPETGKVNEDFKKANEKLLDMNGEVHNDIALEEKVNELVDSNITIICSAGNQRNTLSWGPSDYSATISVIALKQFTNAYVNVKKSNSNYGKAKDLSAPGENLQACNFKITDGVYTYDYVPAGQTSNATPQVTAVAALMLAVDPTLTPDEIRDILCRKATGLEKSGWDENTAAGMVNAYGSVAETARRATAAGKLDISEEKLDTILEQTRPAALEGKHLGTPKITKVSRGKKYLTLYWKYSNPKYLHEIRIYRAKGNGAFKLVQKFKKKTTKWKNTGLKRKTKYRYKIVVYGTTSTGKKIWSPYSTIVTKKTK